jgi:hypothetical protein
MKESWQIDKKIAIADMMHFNEKQAKAFWPVYDHYMNDWCRLMSDRISNIMDHYDDYKNVTASPMIQYRDLFATDVELNKLKKKTYRKVNKNLPSHKARKFMQIEYIFQMVLSREVQQRANLIDDLTFTL